MLSQQFQEKLMKIYEMLSDYYIQDVISTHIPFLKEYKDDPTLAIYINESSQDSYNKVLKKINSMFNNGLADLTKYFTAIPQ